MELLQAVHKVIEHQHSMLATIPATKELSQSHQYGQLLQEQVGIFLCATPIHVCTCMCMYVFTCVLITVLWREISQGDELEGGSILRSYRLRCNCDNSHYCTGCTVSILFPCSQYSRHEYKTSYT